VGKRVNEGGEGIWLMDFIYLYEYIPNWNKETSCNCFKWGREGVGGRDEGAMCLMYNLSLIGIGTMTPPLYNEYIVIKIY
jgi:hypothetical protein